MPFNNHEVDQKWLGKFLKLILIKYEHINIIKFSSMTPLINTDKLF